ncbi:MAG: pseudouridine-5'-phosphate glycosidase, partial [Sulfitobacter sp.]
DAQGVSGKGVTPFLLQRIFELTEGRSLTANIALVRNNARLGAQIAANLVNLPR